MQLFNQYVDYRRVHSDEKTDDDKSKELSEDERRKILETLIQSVNPDEVVDHRVAQEPAKASDLEERMRIYQEQSEALTNTEKAEEFFENED